MPLSLECGGGRSAPGASRSRTWRRKKCPRHVEISNAEEEEVPLSLDVTGSRRFYNNSYNECDALAQTTLRPSNLKLHQHLVCPEEAFASPPITAAPVALAFPFPTAPADRHARVCLGCALSWPLSRPLSPLLSSAPRMGSDPLSALWLVLHQPPWSFGFDSGVCLLLQDLLQSCARRGRRIVEDMCYEIREVGIRSPDGLVVGSCTSSPGVLGSIPKREEPGKTGAPIAADGEWASDPFRIHTTSHAHTARSRIRAGPIVRATFWSSKLSTPRSRRHWFCVVAILCSRSLTQAGPWIIATQPALNALPRLGEIWVSDCMLQRLHARLLPLCATLAPILRQVRRTAQPAQS